MSTNPSDEITKLRDAISFFDNKLGETMLNFQNCTAKLKRNKTKIIYTFIFLLISIIIIFSVMII